jgi:hypothetical protein
MPKRLNRVWTSFLILFLVTGSTLLLAACKSDEPVPTEVPQAEVPAAPAETDSGQEQAPPTPAEPTVIPPTPTPTEPLAALVNGQPIFLADYERELARYEQAQAGLGLATGESVNYRALVLEALIETVLISQAAAANGIVVSPEMVEARLAELVEASGGAENFGAWLQSNQWTEEEFHEALAREMVTEQMVALVTADVPTTAEQVRASYIQLDDPAMAQSLLDQIRAGADFAFLAQQHSLDRITGENGGDLGFFSAGTLLVPEVETAAFTLQPGEVSEVITVASVDGGSTTYYLVLVTERDPQRPLSNELRYSLLQAKFEEWLSGLWAQATVERFVDTGA